MNKSFEIKCPAKINLSLDVINRREDGYHNLTTIMQEIKLFDILSFELCDGIGITLTSNSAEIPTDHNNLVAKAVKLFFEETGMQSKVKIHLDKKIPSGAGLGGGSSDCAGTLSAMNQAFGNPVSFERLSLMAMSLGADVPFFLHGGCMLAEGIGEKLSPLPELSNVHIVVAKPLVSVSTAYVYNNLKLDESTKHPDTKNAIAALNSGDIKLLAASCKNVLESVTQTKYPEISEYKNMMLDCGAALSLMSGSGSSVFGIFEEQTSANKAIEEFKKITEYVFFA